MVEIAQAIYKTPEIPTKFDIIPIHSSDRAAFKRCRRYWDWSSPARNNLMIRADLFGVNVPMWFGTGIHYALEQFYTPGLSKDPTVAFKEWFDIQWRGGIVTEEWLDRVYDLKPQPVAATYASVGDINFGTTDMPADIPTWRVRGLEDIIPDPDHEVFDEHFELGIQMMDFYKQYAEKNDDFVVLMNEHTFSVPIWDFANDRILTAVDKRENSPNYGNVLEVHARGRQDAIYSRNNKLGIIDHKTAASIGEKYFLKLENDEQCTTYLWAAEVEAKYYDLPHKNQPFEEVIYNVLRKAYPTTPTVLKSGMFSVDRENESTTYEILTEWIRKNLPGVKLSEKQQNYIDWLKEIGDENFIIREPVRRNRHQLVNAGQRLYLEALDMLNEPRIYPNIDNDWLCLSCQFRAPCLAKEDGGDYEQLIRDNYTVNKDR